MGFDTGEFYLATCLNINSHFFMLLRQLGWEQGEKQKCLTLLPVLQDTGRNTTCFEVVLQSCTPLHRDNTCSSEPGLLAASDAVCRGSRWGTVKGRALNLWQVALGHPARSKAQPLPVTPFRSSFSRRLKTNFFPEIKFLEYSVLYRAITAWL